jgi:hypothetical protein
MSAEPSFKSNYYVFCMQKEADPTRWNAWNLSQWQFFLLSREELQSAGVGRSISLAKLMAMQQPMTASGFQMLAKTRLR